MVYKKGYYISNVTRGLIHGPRAKELADPSVRSEAIRADIAYGIPFVNKSRVSGFDQVESTYSLLRYRTADGQIYVFSFDPNAKDPWVRNESSGFSTAQTTPELAKVFDELAPRWIVENDAFQRRRGEAYKEAMKAAGITDADFPKSEGVVTIDSKGVIESPEAAKYRMTRDKLIQRIDAHHPVLEPITIAVEGLDEVFRNASLWIYEPGKSSDLPTDKGRGPDLFVD